LYIWSRYRGNGRRFRLAFYNPLGSPASEASTSGILPRRSGGRQVNPAGQNGAVTGFPLPDGYRIGGPLCLPHIADQAVVNCLLASQRQGVMNCERPYGGALPLSNAPTERLGDLTEWSLLHDVLQRCTALKDVVHIAGGKCKGDRCPENVTLIVWRKYFSSGWRVATKLHELQKE
jgi:hypothetical protein